MLRTKASQAQLAAKLTQGSRLVHVVGGVYTFEAVVASGAIGTPNFAKLASPCCLVVVVAERTRIHTGRVQIVEERRGLTFSTVGSINASQAVSLAKLAVHSCNIVKVVGWAVDVASVLAHHHEVG